MWLDDPDFEIRTEATNKSIRAISGNGTAVYAYFTAKGNAKSAVSVQHTKRPDRATADEVRALWTERLSALNVLLTANGAKR